MYANRNMFQSYRQAAEQVSPGRQIVMLYDGVLVKLREARAAIEAGQIERRFRALEKASMIVNGLQSCLDFSNGGEIARQLDSFYNYVFFRLQTLNAVNKVEACDELIANVQEMRDSWAKVVERQAAGTDAPTAAPATVVRGLTISA